MAEAYDEALRRRLDIIGEMGTGATARARARAAAQAQAQAQQQQFSMPNVPGNNMIGPAPSGDFGSFLRAIAGKESGGNYSARNRHSGALGKYQIMPGNIPSWSREALGRSITAQQFYRNPQLQERIAQYKLKQYYSQWGPEGAAVAWYAGPGNARKYMASRGRGYGRPQGQYPSISAYALSILRAMGLR